MSPQTHFEWFSIPCNFDVDLQALRSSYLDLQKQLHPDQSAGQADLDQNQAIRLNTQLNDAYDRLRDPVKRAIYLLELEGIEYDPDRQTQDDPVYLMQQLETRENLAELDTGDADIDAEFAKIRAVARDQLEEHSLAFQTAYAAKDWQAAASAIGRMMFAEKLNRDVNEREEELLDL